MRWSMGLLLVALAACGKKEDESSSYPPASAQRSEAEPARPDPVSDEVDQAIADVRAALDRQEEMAAAAAEGAPMRPRDPDPEPEAPEPPPDDRCVPQGQVARVAVTSRALRLCIDEDEDGVSDRCAAVDRKSGKVEMSEPAAADRYVVTPADLALSGDGGDEVKPPAWASVHVDGDRAEICPTTRVCVDLAPLAEDGEAIDAVRVRTDDAVLAVSLASEGDPRVEVWNLATGRLRSRTTIVGLDADVAFDLYPAFVGDTLVVGASDDAEDVRGWLYDLDGKRRRALAGGSKRLDGAYVVAINPQTIVAVESAPEAPDAAEDGGDAPPPAQLIGTDVASGRVLHRFPLPEFASGDDLILPAGGRVAAWVHEVDDDLRVELLDFATKQRTAIDVPLCF